VATNDPPTVAPVAEDYRVRVQSDLFTVRDTEGKLLASLGPGAGTPDDRASAEVPLGHGITSSGPDGGDVLEIVTVPITIGAGPTDALGTLSLGFALDDALAARFKAVTASEVALGLDGRIRASTLPDAFDEELGRVLQSDRIASVSLGDNEYAVLRRPLSGSPAGGPVALVLRSRTERLSFLRTFRTALGVAGVVAAVLAVLLSYAVARTVTRALGAITDVMREMTATGDLARKIQLEGAWQDEDARLLATTFNTLTDSIGRFQREAALRERLSALGRLSTVIAHEIRNPLMIIKASLRSLRRPGVPAQEIQEAAADIDHEVARLNRIVDDVLDFARPPRMEFSVADLNGVCRDAASATTAGGPDLVLEVSLDPAASSIVTDAERLRTVLVNILSNARSAVVARPSPCPPPHILLRTRPVSADRVAIDVEDQGIGVDPADLPHIFEPYFSTRRTGTGLGLAIAKNIVDSLGGTIGARSRPGEGTQIRIELPKAPPAAAAAPQAS
jgi:signal transduction histidine kinase